MNTRTYGQDCPLALALDVLGDRWTLLIIRELSIAPARYNALNRRLTGIGTNLLAARLRTLKENGLIGQVPGRQEYQLQPVARPVVHLLDGLARWSNHSLPRSMSLAESKSDPRWDIPLIRAALPARVSGAPGTCEIYQFNVEGVYYYIELDTDADISATVHLGRKFRKGVTHYLAVSRVFIRRMVRGECLSVDDAQEEETLRRLQALFAHNRYRFLEC